MRALNVKIIYGGLGSELSEHLADTSAAGLSVLLALKDLDLSNCDSITLQSLSTLMALRTLELFDCNLIIDIGLPLHNTYTLLF